MKLTIRNYRCFEDSVPATIDVRSGFTSFIGVNNSGKSSLLRFFYEFRQLFQVFGNTNAVAELVRGRSQAFGVVVSDFTQLFCFRNSRDIQLTIELDQDEHSTSDELPLVDKVELTVWRDTNTFSAKFYSGRSPIGGDQPFTIDNWQVQRTAPPSLPSNRCASKSSCLRTLCMLPRFETSSTSE